MFSSLPFSYTVGAPDRSAGPFDFPAPMRQIQPATSFSAPAGIRSSFMNTGSNHVNLESQLMPVLKMVITSNKSLASDEESTIVRKSMERFSTGSLVFRYVSNNEDLMDASNDTYALVDWLGACELLAHTRPVSAWEKFVFIGVVHAPLDEYLNASPSSSIASRVLSVAVSGRTRVQNVFGSSATRSSLILSSEEIHGVQQIVPGSIRSDPFSVKSENDVRIGFSNSTSAEADLHVHSSSSEHVVAFLKRLQQERRPIPLIEIYL